MTCIVAIQSFNGFLILNLLYFSINKKGYVR